jgi:glycosyltransferase involved in cell wall biosynthesis
VGYLGRFVAEKGLASMMRVLERVREPWRALLVGTGPMEKEIAAWAERMNAQHGEQRVILATKVRHAQVPAHLNAMDLLMVPSVTRKNWREQFGRMVTEAFASGVPVLSSDSGELPFTVGNAGVVVPEKDESAWIRAVDDLLRSSERRNDLAARGRKRATEHFAWSTVAERTLGFLSGLAKS